MGSESEQYTLDGSRTDVHCSSIWWLRSLDYDNYYATSVSDVGSVNYDGYDVSLNLLAVRPALWINL